MSANVSMSALGHSGPEQQKRGGTIQNTSNYVDSEPKRENRFDIVTTIWRRHDLTIFVVACVNTNAFCFCVVGVPSVFGDPLRVRDLFQRAAQMKLLVFQTRTNAWIMGALA